MKFQVESKVRKPVALSAHLVTLEIEAPCSTEANIQAVAELKALGWLVVETRATCVDPLDARLVNGEAQIAELMRQRSEYRRLLKWALLQLEGESGGSASYWEQYAEYNQMRDLLGTQVLIGGGS